MGDHDILSVAVGRGVQACMRGLEADPDSEALRDVLEEAAQALTLEQMTLARQEVQYGSGAVPQAQGATGGERLSGCSATISAAGAVENSNNYRAELSFHFPQVASVLFKALHYQRSACHLFNSGIFIEPCVYTENFQALCSFSIMHVLSRHFGQQIAFAQQFRPPSASPVQAAGNPFASSNAGHSSGIHLRGSAAAEAGCGRRR